MRARVRVASIQSVGLLLAALLTALLLIPAARAASYDPVASGQTTINLGRSFARLLHRSGVRLEGKGGVGVHGRTVRFPVASGKLEPIEGKGTIEHGGRLVFRAGARKLPLRSLQLKTTRERAPFAAKLGGGQLKLATGRRLRSWRAGFGSEFRARGLRLTAKVAMRLGKKLGLRGVFRAGQRLGAAGTAVEPASVGLAATGTAELSIDPGFASKLQSFFVAVNPIFPGEHPGAFTFPIGGGTLAPDGTGGVVKSTGGLEFIQVGGGQVFIKDPEPDLAAGQLDAEYQLVLAASGAGPNQVGPVLGLGAGAFSTEPATRTLADSGIPLTLTATVAQAFNEAFAKPLGKDGAFAPGERLGTLSFKATSE